MPKKFLLLGWGGSGLFFEEGRGSADFIFMGVGIFPISVCLDSAGSLSSPC